MKLSFHTCGLEWVSFEEAINELADIGYAACGPITGPDCHLDPDDLTDSRKAFYKNLARERNIAFSILNPWRVGGFVDGVQSGETERFYRQILDLAADLGASGVKFLPCTFSDGEREGWRLMIQVLKPLCRHAEEVGIDLLMHNHENHLIDTANGFALLRHHLDSERLQVNLDCANLAILMDDPCRAIVDFKDHLRHVRIKGMFRYYPYSQQCVPGEPGDIVDWDSVFRTLKAVDYTGFVELVPYQGFPPDFPRSGFSWASSLDSKITG